MCLHTKAMYKCYSVRTRLSASCELSCGRLYAFEKAIFIIVTTMIIICEDTRLNSKITTAIGTMQLQYQCGPSPPPTMVSMISSLRKLLASVEVLPHTEHRIWMESQNRSPGLVHRNTRDGHHSAGCEHR